MEAKIDDLPSSNYYLILFFRSHGNFISASAAFMAFNWDAVGAKVAVLPLDTKGRQNKDAVPLIFAHTDFVTDLQFSPFDDGLLATGSQDLTVSFPYFIISY